jgi:hypothetical protein
MRALDGEAVLAFWEAARTAPTLARGITLLARAADRPAHEAAGVPLGERDASLLQLRAAMFGDRVEATIGCPECGERLEFEFHCSNLLTSHRHGAGRCEVELDGWSVVARPPASSDVVAAGSADNVTAARAILLDRCVERAEREGAAVAASALPDRITTAVADALLEADPCAELTFASECVSCGHRWQAPLDVPHLLWSELAAHAQRLVLDVHLIARAYGWSESEILRLSPVRRAAYLALVSA